jgi:hypothetical protein
MWYIEFIIMCFKYDHTYKLDDNFYDLVSVEQFIILKLIQL